MKMIFGLFKYTPFGGLERDMLRLARAAAARGHEVSILAGRWEGDRPAEENIGVELLPLRKHSSHGRAAEYGRRFRAELARRPHDVSVAFNRFGGADFYFAADNCLAVTLSERPAARLLKLLPRYRTFLRLEREIFTPESPTGIFYITPRQKADYRAVYGTPETRFHYLPPGIDGDCRRPDDYETVRSAGRLELGLAAEELMLLLVAANPALKGADRAIAALAALPETLRKRCKLVLVGSPEPAKFADRAMKLGVGAQVHFAGRSNRVASYLAAADLMVHPARNEATGTVLVEALAMGVPVICSAACGFRNFVAESGGWVIPEPFSQSALNAALEQTLNSLPAYRERAAAYGAAADFYRRAETAVDDLEAFGRGEPTPA